MFKYVVRANVHAYLMSFNWEIMANFITNQFDGRSIG